MHGLIWGGASMSSPDQLLATPGPWLVWAHIPYSVALIVAGQGVLIAHGLRSSAEYRLRSAILTVAAAVPLVVGAAFFGSAAASGADPTPLAFSIATLIMAWALFSRRFAGLGPLAYEAVFRSMGDALFLVDESDRVVMMNPEASARSGKTLEEVVGKPVSEVIKPWSEALDHLAESTRGRVAAVLDEEGETRQLEVRVFPLNDWKGGFRGRVFVSQDVTEQSAFSKLEEMAYRDFLTGLLNRRAFYEEAEKAVVVARRRSDKFAMVLLDLDGFKDVNDRHGHAAGDLLLQRVATRLHDELRREDTVGRLGGDEFGVILQDCTTEFAANTVHRLVLAIKSRPFEIKETMVDLDVSAGVALFPEAGDQVEVLVSRADAAMYQAKQGIGGICFFDPEGDELSEELLQLESEMRDALTNEEMEFRYQPICNTATGEAVGVEALVRWRHPVNGITLPDAFLSKFKQRGLAVDLDSHVLRRVLEQVAESSLSVAVNLSSQTAVDVDLPIRVKNLLRATGVEPRRLILGFCQLIQDEVELWLVRGLLVSDSRTRHLPPDTERAISQRPVVGRVDEVPANAEQVPDDSVSGEESLRMAGRFEAAHLSLPLPGRLVGDLGSVVGVLPRVVPDGGHGGPMGCAVAPQFVSHQANRLCALALQ